MFRQAYLRLTAFYVLILMCISFMFSAWVYNEATRELQLGIFEIRAQFDPFSSTNLDDFIQQKFNEARLRVLMNLVYLNIAVLGLGAGASYLLARRTMQPIEEAMKEQERFTADASHELRTPLAAMKAEIEVALRDKHRSSRENSELLKSNLEEIDQLSKLTEDLLAMAHNTKQQPLKKVRLDKVAAKAAGRFTSLAARKNISIITSLKAVSVYAEDVGVEKIIGILIDNAIKYSPPDTKIHVSTSADKEKGYVEVRDDGCGIKTSDLPYIFNRLYRSDESRTKAASAGHGLGLSIAKKLAWSFDAAIEVQSKPQQGSTFTVEFPLRHLQ